MWLSVTRSQVELWRWQIFTTTVVMDQLPPVVWCYIWYLSSQKEVSLLKMKHKNACKQFAEDKQTKDMDYWNHVLWSDETNINLFDSDGIKRVWRQPVVVQRQVCLAYSQACWCVMVWGCMGAAGTGELQFIEGTMNANIYWSRAWSPSLRKLRRAVFQCDNDPKHTSKTITA